MSAIARYYKFKGYPVAGYDRTPSDLTHELEKEGIDVHYEDDIDFIPKDVESTLVVYTPAIPETLGEFVYVKEHNYTLIKRSRMLGELSQGQTCLAVAGTHGKTTTSTMVAHILNTGHNGCSAFLGGISKNYGTNLLMSQTPTLVAAADAGARSGLPLRPARAGCRPSGHLRHPRRVLQGLQAVRGKGHRKARHQEGSSGGGSRHRSQDILLQLRRHVS